MVWNHQRLKIDEVIFKMLLGLLELCCRMGVKHAILFHRTIHLLIYVSDLLWTQLQMFQILWIFVLGNSKFPSSVDKECDSSADFWADHIGFMRAKKPCNLQEQYSATKGLKSYKRQQKQQHSIKGTAS